MKLQNTIASFMLLFFIAFSSTAQNIKSPAEFLGYELGTRFSRHHQVVSYFKYISHSLKNVSLQKYGETNEHRPLYISYISSVENINNLEEIRKNNLKRTGILAGTPSQSNVAIVWLSYNVHGNESSSTEAAMQTLYELVTKKQDWLKNTVVIIDPCINPDGRDRYANWYNENKSTPFNTAQEAKEHHEPWPGGRANHYLFDLNRDWAWATQVESQQRLKVYNQWLPHIHVDFHEQGIDEPYYFAPAAEPYHEIISNWQRDFQMEIGKNNARYFDQEGWLYFTRERFDLFYPSYGDTYPTYMGAIGMTYEQAGNGRAGLGIVNNEGETLTLKDRIAHHTSTGLSTVEVAAKNAQKLTVEFENFFKISFPHKYQSFVLKNTNTDKTNKLLNLLKKHQIKYGYAKNTWVKGYNYTTQKEGKLYASSNDIIVSVNQPKGKMVKVLFEPQAKLSDSLTYDITAWSLPYAHGFEAVASKNLVASTAPQKKPLVENKPNTNAYAYVSKWNSINDAAFLGALLKENVNVRFTEKTFTTQGKTYQPGTLIILKGDNKKNFMLDATILHIANKHQRKLTAVKSGLVNTGADFGAYSVKPINKQRVAVLSGKGTSSLGFGEIWHFFETQLHYPLTVLDTDYFSHVNLDNYDVLILPNGYYSSLLNKKMHTKLQQWVQQGGTLLAIGKALRSFADTKGYALKRKKMDLDTISPNLTPYAQQERKSIEKLITGSIFKSKVDNTHPLAFGYENTYYSLKLSSNTYHYLKNGNNVAYFERNVKNISGFTGSKALENVPESLLFGEERLGRGNIIYMVDNPMFRSFWENGKLFFANAIFFTNSNKVRL